MHKLLLSLLIILCPANANADMFGIADTKMIAQMTKWLEIANKQLEQMEKNASAVDKLRNMEKNKTIKKIGELGEDLGDLFGEAQETVWLLENMQESDGGLEDAKYELKNLIDQAKAAGDEDGLRRLAAYAELISDFEKLSILGEVHEEAIRKNADGGMSEEEAIHQGAYSQQIAAQLQIDEARANKEKEIARKKAILEQDAYLSNMPKVYESLPGIYGSKSGER